MGSTCTENDEDDVLKRIMNAHQKEREDVEDPNYNGLMES